MKKPIVLIVCNALDDTTRNKRGITTDSPAASRKVFQLSRALFHSNLQPIILSLGRGRANKSIDYFSFSKKRVEGVTIIYAPFSNIPLFSELLSLCSFIFTIVKLSRRKQKAVIYYNRQLAYIPSLLTSWLMRYKNFLDLEDGEIQDSKRRFGFSANKLIIKLYDSICNHGALLACEALKKVTTVRPTLCFYGTVNDVAPVEKKQDDELHILMAGTIEKDTGAELLINSIQEMRRKNYDWTENSYIEVTGKGSYVERLKKLSEKTGWPKVNVHGRLDNKDYRKVLSRCQVGLSLKLVAGPLADTTFPSKVVEFASDGLLIVSTDISDVRRLMEDGAYYLTENSPNQLIEILAEVQNTRELANLRAKKGWQRIMKHCSQESSGEAISKFIFPYTK